LDFVNFAAVFGPLSAYAGSSHPAHENPFAKPLEACPLCLSLMLAGSLKASAQTKDTATDAAQEITLGAPFGDHAVLQQQIPLPVWGTTLPGAKVTLAFDSQVKSTVADADIGSWFAFPDLLTPPRRRLGSDARCSAAHIKPGQK
jgi:hypothetical protein